MGNVDQTHPHTNEPFGQSFHGPWPVTDGGRETRTAQTMTDIAHEAPTDGAGRTFQRGAVTDE